MQLYSLTFIYAFLPVSILVYYLINEKYRYAALGVISALFFWLCQPEFLWLFIVTIAGEYLLSETMCRMTLAGKRTKALLFFVIIANVALMMGFSIMNQVEGTAMPLGTMVICFTSIGYFVDCYKDRDEFIRDPADFAAFLGFFGKLFRGPLIRSYDFREKVAGGNFSVERCGDGIYHFIRGAAKYGLLAIPLKNLYDQLITVNLRTMSVTGAWLTVVVTGMMIFYDLSGFCDMARGIGLCFGLSLPKNFYFPYLSPSVTDFLNRFNITVTGFFRHYVYDNLRTRRDSVPQYIVDTFLISILCGIWFGVRLDYVLWGIYIAIFIVLENTVLRKPLRNTPPVFKNIYTFCITMLSMTFFSASAIGPLDTVRAMLGIGDTAVLTDEVSYLVSENVLILALGALFLTKALSSVFKYLKTKHKTLYGVFAVAEGIFLLAAITADLL